jgi:hypothetical protein
VARQRGIVADFVRHPRAAENIALEAMLNAAGEALHAGEVDRAGELLEAVNAALDTDDLLAAPLAADHLHIVHELLLSGYEVQGMRLDAQTAEVAAIREWPQMDTLTVVRAAGGWQLLAGGRGRVCSTSMAARLSEASAMPIRSQTACAQPRLRPSSQTRWRHPSAMQRPQLAGVTP